MEVHSIGNLRARHTQHRRLRLGSKDEGKDNQAVSYEVFAEGWLQGEQTWGRPVDMLVMPDGALLVSDDAAGVIYRIAYQQP